MQWNSSTVDAVEQLYCGCSGTALLWMQWNSSAVDFMRAVIVFIISLCVDLIH